MRRTQIYLQEYQIRTLRTIAQKQRVSLSQVIRQKLDNDLKKVALEEKPTVSAGEWLLQMARKFEKYKVRGPKDLAKNMDKYLYDRDFR